MSFLIAPDGSKEGWERSYDFDGKREQWKEWASGNPDIWIDWIELRYGGDDPHVAIIVGHNEKEENK
jgi:hypothetical protein